MKEMSHTGKMEFQDMSRQCQSNLVLMLASFCTVYVKARFWEKTISWDGQPLFRERVREMFPLGQSRRSGQFLDSKMFSPFNIHHLLLHISSNLSKATFFFLELWLQYMYCICKCVIVGFRITLSAQDCPFKGTVKWKGNYNELNILCPADNKVRRSKQRLLMAPVDSVTLVNYVFCIHCQYLTKS